MCRLRANFPLPYCFSVFCFGSCIFFCLPSADFRRRKDWKVEFPDVSSFPRHSPYRGYGGWPFGNRIHHLMRSFHPSDTNIAEGSIFLPPGKKKILKFLNCLSACTATRSNKSPCTLVHPFATGWPSSPRESISLGKRWLNRYRISFLNFYSMQGISRRE